MGGAPFLAKLLVCPPPVNVTVFILHDYICNYVTLTGKYTNLI